MFGAGLALMGRDGKITGDFMDKREFGKLFKDRVVILDGGMGTLLQKRGMPAGTCPEKWASENPAVVRAAHKDYCDAGSDIIYTFTFGANAIKLSGYGLSEETRRINAALAGIAREAAGDRAYTAGDISSCGSFLAPFGEIGFEEAVSSFKEQARGLLDGGVDLFAVETMMDIQEARAALIAIKELCDLPVIATMTYQSGRRTLMGNDPVSALVTLQSLGADAVGCNCTTGPAEMMDIMAKMKPYAKVPLIAKPNAGTPRLENGETLFDISADSFTFYARPLVEVGANGLGGCCGTTPDYIRRVEEVTRNLKPVAVKQEHCSLVSSNRKAVEIHAGLPCTAIGEGLAPDGKNALEEALINGDMDFVKDIARDQAEAGAGLLKINADVPGTVEKETLVSMINAVCNAVSVPILINVSNPAALEAALRVYPGRAAVNITGEIGKIRIFLSLAKKYGAVIVLPPVDDKGVPQTAAERTDIMKHVCSEAQKTGYDQKDILADALAMPAASGRQGC